MKSKSLKLFGVMALVVILAMNFKFAYSNYGLKTISPSATGAVAFFDKSVYIIDQSGPSGHSNGNISWCGTYCQSNPFYDCIIYIGGMYTATCTYMHSK